MRVYSANVPLMTMIYDTPKDLISAEGTDLGCTGWIEITQERIDLFAEATGDHQWIHTKPDKAKDGPFGKTIAHGYLTLSLTNQFLPELLQVTNISMGVNYGVNKVRFPSPVPVGSLVRAKGKIGEVTELADGVQVIVIITVEVEGSPKPACIVESISRFIN